VKKGEAGKGKKASEEKIWIVIKRSLKSWGEFGPIEDWVNMSKSLYDRGQDDKSVEHRTTFSF